MKKCKICERLIEDNRNTCSEECHEIALSNFTFEEIPLEISESQRKQGVIYKFRFRFKNYYVRKCSNCENLFETTSLSVKCCSKECSAKRKLLGSVKGNITLSQNPEKRKEIYEKAKKTCKERYGAENFGASKQAIQKAVETKKSKDYTESYKKMVETRKEKYGEDYTNLEKYTSTCLERYGCKSFLESEYAREKIKQTCQERYGSDNFLTSEEFRNRNIEKYGVDNPWKSSEFRDLIKQKRFEQMGVTDKRFLRFKNTEDLNREGFLKFFENGLLDITKIMIYFEMNWNVLKGFLDRFELSELPRKYSKSLAQSKLFSRIAVENKIINCRNTIKPLELDIYLPDFKLAIEYDGLMYHSFGKHKSPIFNNYEYENRFSLLKKLELCEKQGIQLLRVFETEPIDLWLSIIHNKLGLNTRIFARKCRIREVSSSECRSFLEENHLQCFINSKINIGLFTHIENTENSAYADITDKTETLVAVMTFSKPRFNKNYEYELIRFCNLMNYNVVGGASKLFKYFLMKYKPKSIISYANRRFSNGDLYYKLGFKLKGISEPNYFYYNPKDPKLESRHKYQKHKLKDILNIYDENLSETMNMYNNGYRKIYDCGNLIFEYY